MIHATLQSISLHFEVAGVCLESFLDIAKVTIAIHLLHLELCVAALVLSSTRRQHLIKVRRLVDARLGHLSFTVYRHNRTLRQIIESIYGSERRVGHHRLHLTLGRLWLSKLDGVL